MNKKREENMIKIFYKCIYIDEHVDDDEFELVNILFQLVNADVWWIELIVKGDFKVLSYCWW